MQQALLGHSPSLTITALWFAASTLLAGIGVWLWSILFFRVGRLNGGRGSKKRVQVGVLINLLLACIIWPISYGFTLLMYRTLPALSIAWYGLFAYVAYVRLKVMANAHSMDLRTSLTTTVMVWAIIGVPLLCIFFWAFNQEPVQQYVIRWMNSMIQVP
jgi:hypothetical protein